MKICVIIQARMGSSRLPSKVIKDICGIPVLIHVVNRVKKSKKATNVIVATTVENQDDIIEETALQRGIEVFRGSELDVLDRYYQCAKKDESDIIVRVTSDNPLLDYHLIDRIVENLISKKADYSCNNIPSTYPYGLDVECFTFEALESAWNNAKQEHEREHVTPYIRNHEDIFKIVSIKNEVDYSHLRWTLDTKEDFEYIKNIYENLYKKNSYFNTEEIIEFLERR